MNAAELPAPQIGRILVAAGLLTEEQLALALEEQEQTGKRLGEIVVRRGFMSGPALANALAEQHGGVLKTEYGFASGLGGVAARRAASESGAPISPLRPPGAAEVPQLRTVEPLATPTPQPEPEAGAHQERDEPVVELEAPVEPTAPVEAVQPLLRPADSPTPTADPDPEPESTLVEEPTPQPEPEDGAHEERDEPVVELEAPVELTAPVEAVQPLLGPADSPTAAADLDPEPEPALVEEPTPEPEPEEATAMPDAPVETIRPPTPVEPLRPPAPPEPIQPLLRPVELPPPALEAEPEPEIEPEPEPPVAETPAAVAWFEPEPASDVESEPEPEPAPGLTAVEAVAPTVVPEPEHDPEPVSFEPPAITAVPEPVERAFAPEPHAEPEPENQPEPEAELAPAAVVPDDRDALIEALRERLDAQEREIADLREQLEHERTQRDVQVHVWSEEQPSPEPPAAPSQPESYLLCVPTPAGYVLLDREGVLPKVGEPAEVPEQDGSFTVTKVVRLPRNGRPCAYLQRA